VEPLDPRRNLFAATLRQTVAGYPPEGWYPEERVSMAQALSCQTVPADVGSRADLVVLARDPFVEPLERTLDNEFRMTIGGGVVLYRAGAAEYRDRPSGLSAPWDGQG
jgi:predicted amidohydrolase YtcJ